MRFAIIDESGRLFDPNDRFLVFAAVITDSLVNLDKIIPSVKEHLPKKTRLAEIKFSTTGDKTKIRVLEEIHKRKLRLFTLVIDKEGRKIKDNPENYAFLVATLLKRILKEYSDVNHIIIDRHFSWVRQREQFNEILIKRLNEPLFIEHLDSQQNTIISLADFVAGAVRVVYSKKESGFIEKIDDLIERQIITSWRDLRQKEKVKA